MQEENLHVGEVSAPFVKWLEEQKHREDEAGKVARYILSEGPFLHRTLVLREQVRSDGEREEYEACLRHVHGASENSMEVFNHVYDEYVRSGPAGDAYNEKVRKTMSRLEDEFGEPQKSGEEEQRIKNGDKFSGTRDAEFWSYLRRDNVGPAAMDEQRRELIEALEAEGLLTPSLRKVLESPEAVEGPEIESPIRTLVRLYSDCVISLQEVADGIEEEVARRTS